MKINIDYIRCVSCKKCVEICPANVYELQDNLPVIKYEEACTLCGVCADQCPKQAITIESPRYISHYKIPLQAKRIYVDYSRTLENSLGLKKQPVAVKLITDEKLVPKNVRNFDFPIRHCVSINMASHGAGFYLSKQNHACSAAKAALGLADLPEKVKNGKVPFMHGLTRTQETAAKIMGEIPKLPLDLYKGTLLSPLETTPFDPDVIILTLLPKQAMWIANSLLYERGGPRISAHFAGMQASCSDVTALPILKNEVNFSMGCYGCRSAGKLADDEMYIGIPGRKVNEVVTGLIGLKKAMKNLQRTT